MIYEFTLQHPVLGSLIISEPGLWKDTKLRLERHKDFHAVVEYFGGGEDDDNAGDFIFYGDNGVINGGIDRIREVIRLYGPDTDLFVFIRISFDNYTFYNAFSGQLALWGIKWLPNNKAQVPITRGNLWSKFINNLETPVDIQSPLSLDGTPVDVIPHIDMVLPSQIINKTTRYTGNIDAADDLDYELLFGQDLGANGTDDDYVGYHQAQIDLEQEEIDASFSTPIEFVLVSTDIVNTIELVNESGELTISLNHAQASMFLDSFYIMDSSETDPTLLTQVTIVGAMYYVINADPPVLMGTVADTQPGFPDPGVTGVAFPYAVSFAQLVFNPAQFVINVNVGDLITVYIKWDFQFNLDIGTTDPIRWLSRVFELTDYQSDISFTLKSLFHETTAQVFLTHDVGGSALDRIVSEDEVLYSEFLGGQGTHRSYESNGCGYPYVNVKGLQLRQYDLIEKPFFTSFKQWWNGINPILNLCLFQDLIDGKEVIRIEQKAVAYDKSTVSVRLSNVIFLDGSYDETVTFKTARTGNKEWKSEAFTSIDDWAKQTRASRIQKAGTDAVVESEFIAAPLAIESVRRSVLRKSENNKFDDNTFIIAVNEDDSGSPIVYTPQLEEHFTSITNLLNPETRYNSILTPTRSFFRWLNYFSIGLQEYLGSFFKFTSGEGNYDMASDYAVSDGCENYDPVVSEKMDIEVSDEPLHTNKKFNFDCPMGWEEYLSMQANLNASIELSQTDAGYKKFFLIDLVFQPFKSRASGNVWAVDIDFEIQVIQTEILGRVCDAVIDDGCEDAYLTENSFELITEDGDCLVLE